MPPPAARSACLPRDLSAPVKLRYKYSDEDLAFLMKHDTDSFNRWEAGQQVHTFSRWCFRACALLVDYFPSVSWGRRRGRNIMRGRATAALPFLAKV